MNTLSEYYQKGRDAGLSAKYTKHGAPEAFQDIFNKKPECPSFEWDDFFYGFEKGTELRLSKQFKVKEFLEELNALCKKYNAVISTGCGCCGAGFTIGDYEGAL
jgi:hypothetical protein